MLFGATSKSKVVHYTALCGHGGVHRDGFDAAPSCQGAQYHQVWVRQTYLQLLIDCCPFFMCFIFPITLK